MPVDCETHDPRGRELAEACMSQAPPSSTLKRQTINRKNRKIIWLTWRTAIWGYHGYSTLRFLTVTVELSMLSWLQCYYVSILSHVLLAATRCVDGVSVVIGHNHGAVTQGCFNASGEWDALWEGPNRSGVVRPVASWVSVEVSVAAVGYPLRVECCQTVILQNEVAIIIFIITVPLCNAVAVVTTDSNNRL